MTLEELNTLEETSALEEFGKCCGAKNWIERMVTERPFDNENVLTNTAEKIWFDGSESDWLEAFAQHPKIGDVDSLAKKYASTKEWAGNEQKSVDSASSEVIRKLAELNTQYEERFGFIFIVCATGKSAEEMLEILESRIDNGYQEELKIAMGEQHKITTLRLKKLIS